MRPCLWQLFDTDNVTPLYRKFVQPNHVGTQAAKIYDRAGSKWVRSELRFATKVEANNEAIAW